MEMVAKFQPPMVKIRFAVEKCCKNIPTVPGRRCVAQFQPPIALARHEDVALRPDRRCVSRCRELTSSAGVQQTYQSQVSAKMIKWILILLVIAAVASLLGFGRLAGAAATGAQILIGVVLILFLLVILGVIALA
jgi:uncharacterized membrane protein YtjA (UPF0391 family)